jgi:hypothetical protein
LSDDLERELLQGLDEAPRRTGRPPADRKPTEPPKRSPSDLDRQLLKQLGDGEDVGETSPDPLVTLSRRMRTVEERIQQRDTAETTQRMQQEIVAELAALIEQLNKQCSGGQCNSSNAPAKPGSKPGSGKKGGTGNATASNQPAKDSTDTLRRPGGDHAELETMQHLIKEVWGHLPPKLREQLQSSSVEQFLPKYEQLIEAYYKRLAEDRRE